MEKTAGKPAHEIVRIEAVADEVAKSGVSASDFASSAPIDCLHRPAAVDD